MNWLRTILEPKGFSVMLPKGINTPKKEIPKKNMKPVLCAILSAVLAGIGLLLI